MSQYKDQFDNLEDQSFTTFKKINDQKVKKYPSLKSEVEQLTKNKVTTETDTIRKPAATAPAGISRHGRILIGTDLAKYQDPMVGIKMVNEINADWKENLAEHLMRFQDAETKVMVKKEASLIKIEHGIGRYVEVVNVGYLNPDNKTMGFRAMVDSESGALISTWDRSIYGQQFKNDILKFKGNPLQE